MTVVNHILFVTAVGLGFSCAPAARERSGSLLIAKERGWFHRPISVAFDEAQQRGKPLLTIWGARWCMDCSRMHNEILVKQAFEDLATRYSIVYLDMDEPQAQDLAKRWQINSFPQLLVVGTDGQPGLRLQGGEITLSKVLETL